MHGVFTIAFVNFIYEFIFITNIGNFDDFFLYFVKMLIIADNRIPDKAKQKLLEYGNVIFLETQGITYEAISGHPDIFFCKIKEDLVIVPNLPNKFKKQLKDLRVNFIEGDRSVGTKYPATSSYNAVVTQKYLIHNLKYTDSAIKNATENLIKIDVNQAYTRCNLLPLNKDSFITSDRGTEKALLQNGLDVLYVDSLDILLPGFPNGFFGGACGVYEGKVFVLGSLDRYNNGRRVRSFIERLEMEIIELCEGKLFDGGSLIFYV